MANTYTTLSSLFTAIANAIRSKTGSSDTIKADDFPTAIANIPTSGGTPHVYGVSAITIESFWTPGSPSYEVFGTKSATPNACYFLKGPNITNMYAGTLVNNFGCTTANGIFVFADMDGQILWEGGSSNTYLVEMLCGVV